MPGTTATTRVAYFVTGALLAGLVAAAVFVRIRSGDDEERPPIIVRGGSLIFQSGVANGPADERQGKPWLGVGGDWQPDHLHGVPVNVFTVAINGTGLPATCPSMERTREIAVTYTENGQSTVFRFQSKPRPSGSHRPAPTIVGSGLREEATATANPQLVFGQHGGGQITRVQYRALGAAGDIDCPGPFTFLKIWQGN